MTGYYSVQDVEDIKKDITAKINACSEVGLGDITHTLNEAQNLIDWLLESEKERVVRETKQNAERIRELQKEIDRLKGYR